MNNRTLTRFLILVLTTISMAYATEHPRDRVLSNRTDRLSAQSDLVALVNVKAIDFIGKPTKAENRQVIIDVYSYGRLVSLRPVNVYLAKSAEPPDKVYVFQKGAVQGLDQSRFEIGQEYVVFLKSCSPPALVTNNVETSPALPRDSYYSVIEERNGVVAKGNTNAFLKMDASLRAKMRAASRPVMPLAPLPCPPSEMP